MPSPSSASSPASTSSSTEIGAPAVAHQPSSSPPPSQISRKIHQKVKETAASSRGSRVSGGLVEITADHHAIIRAAVADSLKRASASRESDVVYAVYLTVRVFRTKYPLTACFNFLSLQIFGMLSQRRGLDRLLTIFLSLEASPRRRSPGPERVL